jgi:hypothetical protein
MNSNPKHDFDVLASRDVAASLGKTVITPEADAALSDDDVARAFRRHLVGDWGECHPTDWRANDEALRTGMGRLFSAYYSAQGVKFYVITEADRSVTTVLLPADY